MVRPGAWNPRREQASGDFCEPGKLGMFAIRCDAPGQGLGEYICWWPNIAYTGLHQVWSCRYLLRAEEISGGVLAV